MKKQNALSPKHVSFCSHYARLGNATEAAVSAGYKRKTADAAALRLLSRKEIRDEVAHCREQLRQQAADAALAGLTRLALGGTGDAVGLILRGNDPDPKKLDELDFFAVSEIKSPKGGGLEIKFYDRIKALELLLCYSRENRPEGEHSFYSALDKAAASLREGAPGREDFEI